MGEIRIAHESSGYGRSITLKYPTSKPSNPRRDQIITEAHALGLDVDMQGLKEGLDAVDKQYPFAFADGGILRLADGKIWSESKIRELCKCPGLPQDQQERSARALQSKMIDCACENMRASYAVKADFRGRRVDEILFQTELTLAHHDEFSEYLAELHAYQALRPR